MSILGMRLNVEFALAVLMLPGPALLAASHYVRVGAGGKATGSDWTNAYPSIPQVLVRGDTYYVADGFYGVYSFNQSGTTLTTVKKATVSDHGTEIGWDNGYGDGQAVFQRINFYSGSGWVLDGNTRTSISGGHGFKIDGNANAMEGFGIFFRREEIIDGVTVRYTEIAGRGASDTVEYAAFYCLGSGAKTNIRVDQSYIHDIGVGIPVHIGVNGFTLENSVIARNVSTTSMHSEQISSTNSNNVIIRNNILTDADGTGFIVELNSGVASKAVNWKIYGNVFHHPMGTTRSIGGDGVIVCINGQVCENWMIVNNSFVTIHSGNNTSRVCLPGGRGNIVKNNIWYSAGNAVHCTPGLVADFNYYVNTAHTGEVNEQISPTTDPFINRDGLNLRLVRGTSPGISIGTEFAKDADGVTRGVDGVWDKGAFERNQLKVITPPGALTAKPNS